ncbi:MAG: TolC family protein [Deltaproteobacteria bacterium]|jgi:outer membrane protein|nr:TolC family protein [Deltaproteobacteria bacterium]
MPAIFKIKVPLILAALFLAAGCADADRHVVAKPFLVDSPSALTIFGEATLGDEATGAKTSQIIPPPPPHDGPLSLEECIEAALRVSPSLDSAQQNQMGALWSRHQAVTNFLPTASTSYGVTRRDRDRGPSLPPGRSQYSWQTTVTQPLFTGGRNLANYYLAQLGVQASKIQVTQAAEDLILAVKQAYFSILASEKALRVAQASVVNLTSHLYVTQSFLAADKVSPKEVLEAEVELAKAQLEETDQELNLETNRARLNILLRRPVEAPLAVKDNLRYAPFPHSLDYCLETGLRNNPEILLGRNQVEAGAKQVDLARSDLYPQVNLQYTNASTGNTPRAHGGYAADSSSWNFAVVASFNFWEWGRSKAEVEKSKVALNQAVDALTSLEDNARLDITSNYQKIVSAAKSIDVSAKAVTLAAEDLRIVTERFAEGMGINTDVLDAQTRYSEAQYDHFQALYNYNLAWAVLERSLGLKVEPGST